MISILGILQKPSLTPLLKIFTIILLSLSTWLIGLFLFISNISSVSSHDTQSTDAIVVLTGGAMRLSEGLEVFANVKAKKILISGVGKGFSKRDIIAKLKKINLADKIDPQDIILGNIAITTQSNAFETKIFMTLHNFKSLRLVTSNYHMQRSAFLFRRTMPNITIIEHPVLADNFIKKGSYLSMDNIKIATNEYNKFLGAILLSYLESFEDLYNKTVVYFSTTVRSLKTG